MKLLVFFALVVVAAAHSSDRYDINFNVDEVTDNERLLCAYGKCFCGTGKCTPEGNDIKGLIAEGTETTCEKCSPKQKVMVAKFIKALKVKCPNEWEILSKRADPEGKRSEDLEKFLLAHAS
uniref:Chemosensory protein 18 n=1 Tax=Apocheima cinerarius TaxID=706528 RepID=A0A8T9EJ89_APOCI|nr:chemosensory protein 18 [Apocheima cinerarius]